MEGIRIDWETADRITCANLIDHKKMIEDQLEKYGAGGWMHPEDVASHKERLEALSVLIKYFGS